MWNIQGLRASAFGLKSLHQDFLKSVKEKEIIILQETWCRAATVTHCPPEYRESGGDMAQEVRSVVWQSEGSHPGHVEVSLSETPNPQLLLTSWLVPCMAANHRECVSVCV